MAVQTQATEQVRETVAILGLPVDRVSMEQAMERIAAFVATKKPHLVITADSSGIVQAQSDSEFHELMKGADLVTPDSIGILWAARRKGEILPERVSGVDLLDRICAKSADKGWRLYFLGSEPGIAEMAAEKIRLKYPGCNIVGTRHGYFPSDSDDVVASEVAAFKPDVLFVAMGIPRQEKFIRRTMPIIGAPVAIGVGGSFDVFSGRTRRAPKIIQRLSLEWLWRTVMNPRKWRKALALPRFAWLVLRSR